MNTTTLSTLAKPPWRVAQILLGLMLFAGPSPSSALSAPPLGNVLEVVKDYPLPGRATRWDYMSFDAVRSRMIIAHLGDSAVVVVDTKTKALIGTVEHISDVHGVLVIPALDRIYASATGSTEVVAIDARTLKIIARIPTGKYPDGLAYAPSDHKIYVSNESGESLTVVDVRSNKGVATIALGGSVGNTQYDAGTGHIFANVQGTKELVEIDPATDAIVQRTAIPGADGNHGLLIEPNLRLAFIACEGNDLLIVLDLRTKKALTQFHVGRRPDVLGYDAPLRLLYVASESGVASVFKVGVAGATLAGEGFVGPNAHTLAVDTSTHEAYFPLKEKGQSPILRVMRPVSPE
ncbi:MAG: hypothetical protein NVSMB6_06980 [Burkholderiaceae bacterium]